MILKQFPIPHQKGIDDIEAIPYASSKRVNDIDDIETISYASSK